MQFRAFSSRFSSERSRTPSAILCPLFALRAQLACVRSCVVPLQGPLFRQHLGSPDLCAGKPSISLRPVSITWSKDPFPDWFIIFFLL